MTSSKNALLVSAASFCVIASCPALARATGGDELWHDVYNPAPGVDMAFSIAAKGPLLYVGGSSEREDGTDFVVRAYESRMGFLVWESRYDEAGHDDLGVLDIAVSGNVVIAVGIVASSASNHDWFVRAYDARTGAVLWDDRHDEAGDFDRARAVAAHGRTVVVCGDVKNAAGDDDGFARAYDRNNGTLLWEKQIDGGGTDFSQTVAVRGRTAIVAGESNDGPLSDFDFVIHAYDARTGALLWSDEQDEAGGGDVNATGLSVQGSRVVVGGVSGNANGDGDAVLRAYDKRTGAMLWEEIYDQGGANDGILDVAVKGSTVYAAGYYDFVRAHDIRTGALRWSFDFVGNDDFALGGIDAKGGVVAVAGVSFPSSDDFWVEAFDARTGAPLWEDTYDRAGSSDVARDVLVTGRGVIAVGNVTSGSGTTDWFVRSYDAK